MRKNYTEKNRFLYTRFFNWNTTKIDIYQTVRKIHAPSVVYSNELSLSIAGFWQSSVGNLADAKSVSALYRTGSRRALRVEYGVLHSFFD